MGPWVDVRTYRLKDDMLEPVSGGPVPKKSDPLTLPADHHRVEVWHVGLEHHAERLEQAGRLLVFEEIRALDGMVEPYRSRKLLARASLRALLSRYLGVPPAAVGLTYGRYGKPGLGGDLASSGLEFNSSTSENRCLIAVSKSGPVGIDIETVADMPYAEQLARRFFARADVTALEAGGGDARTFLRLWTAKEAYAKALGVSLSMSLAKLVVPQELQDRNAVTVKDARGARLCLIRTDPAPETVATLAIRSWPVRLTVLTGIFDLDAAAG